MRAASSVPAPTLSFILSTSASSGISRARPDLPRPRLCRSCRSTRGKTCSTAWIPASRWRALLSRCSSSAALAALARSQSSSSEGYRSHCSGDCVAPRDDELGQGSRRSSRHRQWQAVAALGIGAPGFVFSTTHTADHLKETVELIAPQGRLALINNEPLELALLMRKSISTHWESMVTRSMLQTADMTEQRWSTPARSALRLPSNAANLKRAHALLETGQARGKIVLEGSYPHRWRKLCSTTWVISR